MRQECPLNLAVEENYAIGVGPSRFVVSARSGIVARQTCFDRVERQVAISGLVEVNIPAGCASVSYTHLTLPTIYSV